MNIGRLLAVAAASLLSAGSVASAATIYASTVVSHTNSQSMVASDGVPNFSGLAGRYDPDNALYPADGAYYSVSTGGQIILGFGSPPPVSFQTPVSLIEFTLPGHPQGNPPGSAEKVDLYVSNDPSGAMKTFVQTFPGSPGGSTTFSTTFAGIFKYVILKDSLGGNDTTGFDVDSVSVTSVPIPASVWSGVGLFAVLGALKVRRQLKA